MDPVDDCFDESIDICSSCSDISVGEISSFTDDDNYDCDYDLSDQTEDTRVENALNESCGTEIFHDSSDPFCQQIPDHCLGDNITETTGEINDYPVQSSLSSGSNDQIGLPSVCWPTHVTHKWICNGRG